MPSLRTWLALAAFAATATVTTTAPGGLFSGTAFAAQRGPDWGTTCMTDDGYGRKRPCSSAYKAANPNWRGGDDCFTDEGYGRFRPCSANYKAKHGKK